jgi:hypothetical protein
VSDLAIALLAARLGSDRRIITPASPFVSGLRRARRSPDTNGGTVTRIESGSFEWIARVTGLRVKFSTGQMIEIGQNRLEVLDFSR